MSEATVVYINNPNASSAIVPVKRRRGRPRKHPKVDHLDHSRTSHSNFSSGGGVNRSHQPNSVNNNDIMLGQPVVGVIEAVFDAGYLLSVRIGNSGTNLKGVVFKPGHYIPVSAENDIAPDVRMIPRNEFPIPREVNTPIRRRRYRTRERNGTSRVTPRAVASSGNQVLPLITQTAASPGISRGNVVPVVLHPVTTVSNGVAINTSEPSSVAMAPHMMTAISKGKGVPNVAADPLLSGPSSFAQQLAEAEKQAQTSFVYNSSTTTKPQHDAGGKCTQSAAGMHFEKLLSDVMMKRVEIPSSESPENNSSFPGTCLSVKDSGLAMGDDEEEEDEYQEDDDDEDDEDDDDTDQPLTVEPLRSIQPNLNNPPADVSAQHMGSYMTGKMTELLQVVQKNVMENQVVQAGQPSQSGTEQGVKADGL
ncbi:unnamed protein product [Linum tenue]|uniref:Uncharacterized protein n=1 Tax=Linum tenue TaxID=586396 RepID=A0AAV0H3E3_9ROSI|nr:unnamed protein product [Linum tenue]